ncbi:hypothetical protein O181_076586 [Austropuccinia psidii MF-1]|uniref:Integrase catalytic domain-containing protein n=1 Tax=Austropuccinia psidii MF-1 TaxID=1389203 RepID=A0A9Q3FGI5_9BASI|nr:hypothetical protein [Austropuccinia psidii MF-1]
MDWVAIAYKGNLDDFIKKCRKALVDLASVNIKIPPDVLSYMILGKLCDHTSMYHLADSLAMSTEATENPTVTLNRLQNYARHLGSKQKDPVEEQSNTALLTNSSSHPSKLVYYCANGVHNPLNTTHKPSRCYIEFPHLRPKKKEKDNQSPSTHLSSTQALVTSTGIKNQERLIIIDSAATHHMFSDKSMFINLKRSAPFLVSTGDPTSNLFGKGIGSVNVMVEGKTLTLENCIYVPKISHNIISLLELFKSSITIEKLASDRFVIKQSNKEILSGKISNRLMTVLHQPAKALVSIGALWHQRLGHPSHQSMKTLGLPSSHAPCEICLTGKSSLLSFPGSFDKVQHSLDCIHLDVVGPINPSSNTGFKYFLTIVDQFTSFKSVMFLKAKSEAFDEFVKWKTFSENFHNTKIKRLVSDKGGEFENERFRNLAASCGFIHTFSPTATPEHNGFAERANRTILDKARCNKSPFFLWAAKLPRLKRLRTFGCKAFILIRKKDRDWKLAPTSEEGVLLGFENDNSSYRILRLIVNENHDSPSDGHETIAQESPSPCVAEQPDQVVIPENPRRIRVIGPRHPTLIRGDVDKANILPFPRRPKALISMENAIERELKMMKDLEVWEVVKLEPHHKVVGTTWVFKKKKNITAEQSEYKAQLCAQGFAQTLGEDYSKTFAPTGRMHSLRTLIAFLVTNALKFQQLDIRSVFLNAKLEEDVYLGIPQGLNLDKKSHCLKLKKAIYGLKQAPLAWYKRLTTWLLNVGFTSSLSDPCVFHRLTESPIWLFFHVDDIAVFGKDVIPFKNQLKSEFDVKDIGDAELMLGIKVIQIPEGLVLSQAHYIESLLVLYGMENCRPVVTPMVPGLHLTEASLDQQEAFKNLKVNYRSAVGSLSYLSTATRPDISFAVSSLSQFLELPGIEHWKAFLHVLRYLRGTAQQSLVYHGGKEKGVQSYSDANWGNCPQTRRSITGFVITFNGCLVVWKTRKQPTVSLSTAEAEYKALTDLTTELLWLRQFIKELSLGLINFPIDVFSDNQACINTANSDSNSNNRRMKHVEIQLHFIREVINQKKIRVTYVPTHDMLADFMTKSVGRTALNRCLGALHVLCLRARGDVEINTTDE